MCRHSELMVRPYMPKQHMSITKHTQPLHSTTTTVHHGDKTEHARVEATQHSRSATLQIAGEEMPRANRASNTVTVGRTTGRGWLNHRERTHNIHKSMQRAVINQA